MLTNKVQILGMPRAQLYFKSNSVNLKKKQEI